MSYQVLARKYRSGNFDDLIGQEAIAATLKNAIALGRVHHGYLFTGTRGVGKTSSARILAKALNCLAFDKPTPTPCLVCDACRAIAEGEDLDVIEIDAASNTGVDNIRDLRGNAALRPARSRFKVYIIDEVHMLSTGAFNALLKTLEEPPDHVKFILATTELHKVPATIQSRCQRFDFRALPPEKIADHLMVILEKEGVKAEESACRRMARLAAGSMRDGLSLLDKVISFESKAITLEILEKLLPPSHDELCFRLTERLIAGEAGRAITLLDEAVNQGQTLDRFAESLMEHFRTLMLIRTCGAESDLVDIPSQVVEEMKRQATAYPAQTYVYLIGLVEELRRSVRYSGAGRALADALIVRLALATQFMSIEELLAAKPGQALPTTRTAEKASVEKKKPDGEASNPVNTQSTDHRSAPSVAATTRISNSPRREESQLPSPVLATTAPRGAGDKSKDALLEVMADPLVRQALDLFEGHIESIEESPPKSDRERRSE